MIRHRLASRRCVGLPLALGLGVAFAALAVGSSACDDGMAPPPPMAAASGIAIVSGDFDQASSSVALYNPATGEVRDDCLHSNSPVGEPPSSDVTLPSQPQLGGELLVLDRSLAVLSFVRPADCQVRAQLGLAPSGFNGNPHDVIVVAPNKAYVTRYQRNLDPSATDQGEDLLIIDPSVPMVTGRIALREWAASADVEARPDRAVLVDGKVYVTLNNLSTNYEIAGPGRVVVIDPATNLVTAAIDLAEQQDCSALEYVAATKSLWVSCGVPGDTGLAGSALVEINLSAAGTPAAGRVIRADTLGTRPLNFASLSVTEGLVFGVTVGQFGGPATDALHAIPLGGGAPSKLMDGGSFAIGRTALVPAGTTLLVPDGDATNPRVHTFSIVGTAVTRTGDFVANPAGGLPPREAARY
jgi:hypothetical protein